MYIQSVMLEKLQEAIFVINRDLYFTDVIDISKDKSSSLKNTFLKTNIRDKNIFSGIDYNQVKKLNNNEFLRFENSTRQGIFEYNFVKIDRDKIICTFKRQESSVNQEKVIQLKNNFISSVNHEFRTPLNGIIGISSSFLADDDTCGKLKKGLKIINKNGSKLLSLIENLLNFSKLESRNYDFHKKEVFIGDLINFCNNIMYNFIESDKKNVKFEVVNNLSAEQSIMSDEKIITEIFSNILTNAFKFTDSGVIKFNVSEDEENFIFEISSSNLRISQDKMRIVMTKLVRESLTEKCRTTGVGLLAKSKFLTEIIGGNIIVEGKDEKSKIVCLIKKNPSEGTLNQKNLLLLKKHFISSIRSEFKIPLKRIEKMAYSFMTEEKINSEFREGLELIYNSAQRLNLLIVNLLDFSKLESGDFKMKYSPIKISEIINFIENKMDYLVNKDVKKNKDINFLMKNYLNKNYEFVCDRYILKNILCNILENAEKFTDSGNIIFKTFETEEKIVFEISDSGIGISKNDMEHMFESFKKGKHAYKFSGLGIGLSKSKLFAEYIQGEIDIESEQGMGTKVCFSLPKLLVRGETL